MIDEIVLGAAGADAATGETGDVNAIDDLIETLQDYAYTDYLQEPACGIARMNEQQFTLVKGQLIDCWTQIKGLTHNMHSLEELLLL